MSALKVKVPSLGEIRKALIAAGGLLAQVVELGVLHGTALHVAQILSGAISSVLVYVIPNDTPAKPTV